MNAVSNYRRVRDAIAAAELKAGRAPGSVTLVVVTKTFAAETVRPLLAAGHRVFGENRVQEAKAKWPTLRQEFPDTELHLIGPLQTNKVKEAVRLFDVIETLDREKLASALAEQTSPIPRLFVQVNTGAEPQKAGIHLKDVPVLLAAARKLELTVEGLMCIPPVEELPGPHFAALAELARECGIRRLSMGMSGDFEEAIALGATHVRVGSAIFGARG